MQRARGLDPGAYDDQAVFDLWKQDRISPREALRYAGDGVVLATPAGLNSPPIITYSVGLHNRYPALAES